MKTRFKFWITLGVIFGVGLLSAGVYTVAIYQTIKETAIRMYQPIDSRANIKPIPLKKQVTTTRDKARPISILLMGVDDRKKDTGHSERFTIMTLNPRTETMQLVSIPRNTRTELIGRGTLDKINHAYAYGGAKMTIDTMEHFINTKIDYYIRYNIAGLSQLVDCVDGITVDNKSTFKRGNIIYPEGEITLNGKKTLGYIEGQNNLERQVIQAVMNKVTNVNSISKYNDILNILGRNIRTNLTFDDMKYLIKSYRSVRKHVIYYEAKGQETMINKISYIEVSVKERQKIASMISNQLRSPSDLQTAKN